MIVLRSCSKEQSSSVFHPEARVPDPSIPLSSRRHTAKRHSFPEFFARNSYVFEMPFTKVTVTIASYRIVKGALSSYGFWTSAESRARKTGSCARKCQHREKKTGEEKHQCEQEKANTKCQWQITQQRVQRWVQAEAGEGASTPSFSREDRARFPSIVRFPPPCYTEYTHTYTRGSRCRSRHSAHRFIAVRICLKCSRGVTEKRLAHSVQKVLFSWQRIRKL